MSKKTGFMRIENEFYEALLQAPISGAGKTGILSVL